MLVVPELSFCLTYPRDGAEAALNPEAPVGIGSRAPGKPAVLAQRLAKGRPSRVENA